MVAAQSRANSGAQELSQAEAAKDAYGKMRICWAPRTGRSKDFKRWQFDILDRLANIGYESIEQVLALEAPDKDALAQLTGDGGERRATRASNTEELFAQALEEYQAMNAKIYDIVHPSLIFIGTHEEDDLETIRKYRKGALKNGIGLRVALRCSNSRRVVVS